MSYLGVENLELRPVFRFRGRMMTSKCEINKKLFMNFDEEPGSPGEDAIRVVLRMKPSSQQDNIVQILDSRTLVFKLPSEFSQSRRKLNIPDEFKYTFSHIYRSDVTQSEIFSGCVAHHVKDLFAGRHCLLFTYGTTNAGKTFTVLGTGAQPGIIPRTLTTVFKSIKGKEYGTARIMPHMFNSALEVADQTLEEELAFKQRILTWNPDKTQDESNRHKTQSTFRSSLEAMGEAVFKEMQRRLTNDTSVVEYQAEPEDRFSVWVSFAEIYNECIYDLLQPIVPNGKRKILKLAQDNKKNIYIKGLKHIFVESEEEAYKVLMFGKNNLQVAATGMNSRSSRSHCIFSIKLIKCPNVEQPVEVIVSSYSICDLAGAERQKKALNVGLRLKESQNINSSLHVLSRCFNIIRENQTSAERKLIPFRESKLTQLFQHALLGKESVTMIVNVNADRDLCEETQHVLKASAIAKHIIVQPRAIKRPNRVTRKSLFSQIISGHNRSTLIRWDSAVKVKAEGEEHIAEDASEAEAVVEGPNKRAQEQYEELLAVVENLKEKLKEEKAKHRQTKQNFTTREDEIREEMRAELDNVLQQVEQQNANDKKRVRDIKEDEGRVISSRASPEKKSKRDLQSLDDNSEEVDDLRAEIKMQNTQIECLTDLCNSLREEKKEVTMDLSLAKFQLSWKQKDIDILKKKIEILGEEGELKGAYIALEKEMADKLQARDKLLEEARNDYLEELSKIEDLEEEIKKLEKELLVKEEENYYCMKEIEELKQDVSAKTNQQENIEENAYEMEKEFTAKIKNLEKTCQTLEKEIEGKNEKINQLELSEEELSHQITQLKSENNRLLCELKEREDRITTLTKEFDDYREKTQSKLQAVDAENKIYHDQSCQEVSILEKSLKQEIQETTRVAKKLQETVLENKKLTKEQAQIKATLNELKCKLVGYENTLPTLQAEFDRQREEAVQYKMRCEDQVMAIVNLNQEKESFQANQKEIIGKYEEQLKKTKDENDTLKKEIARLTTTFYRSTPTPKKDLEKQIDDLKKQLEESRISQKQAEEHVNRNVRRCQTMGNTLEVSDDDVFSGPSKGTNTMRDRKAKSASKVRSQRTKSAVTVDPTTSEDENKANKKPQTQTRKKLWNLSTQAQDEKNLAFEEVEIEQIPQESPGTMVKRTLRKRNK